MEQWWGGSAVGWGRAGRGRGGQQRLMLNPNPFPGLDSQHSTAWTSATCFAGGSSSSLTMAAEVYLGEGNKSLLLSGRPPAACAGSVPPSCCTAFLSSDMCQLKSRSEETHHRVGALRREAGIPLLSKSLNFLPPLLYSACASGGDGATHQSRVLAFPPSTLGTQLGQGLACIPRQ